MTHLLGYSGPWLLLGSRLGRSHKVTWAGCIVSLTTSFRSSLKAFRSVSSLSLAEKVSTGTLLMTDKAIDKLHQLIHEWALYRRNLTLMTATVRSHDCFEPYSNKVPLGERLGRQALNECPAR